MALALVLLFSATDVSGKPRSAYSKANSAAVSKVDSAIKAENNVVEEADMADWQDTAAVDTIYDDEDSNSVSYVFDDDEQLNKLLTSAENSIGKIVAFCIFMLFIVGLPFILIIVIGVLIYKNRKNRYQMMMKAMETGQPLPETMRPTAGQSDEYLWRKGIKKLFVGGGLAVVSVVWDSTMLLTGIGLLIMFYGLGQMAIAYSSAKDLLGKKRKEDEFDVNE